MEKKPKPEPDDKEQSQRFVETAKSLGVDESGESFEIGFNSIASTKPIQQKADYPKIQVHKKVVS